MSASSASPAGPVGVVVLSVAASMLALFQWMELLVVRSGGTAVCSVNETISCERVWDSAFAARIHAWTGLPVAGWGLVWGLTCLFLSLLWVARRLRGQSEAAAAAGLQWAAAAGICASIAFAAASFRTGALCLTCLGTYALAAAFAVSVARFCGPFPPAGPAARDGLLWAGAAVLAVYLLALFPGLRTPHSEAGSLHLPNAGSSAAAGTESPLRALVNKLSPGERQFLSDAVAEYRASPPIESHHPIRLREGPENAGVQLVEFTDVLCPHCRHFGEGLAELRRALPPDAISVEPRQYPLDGACNPQVERSDGTGVRCLAAKLLICLEPTPDYWRVSHELFAQQENLTPDRVMEIASSGPTKAAALQACANSEETNAKLLDDIQYAQQFHIRGTPLVLANGRVAAASPLFLYALALAQGNLDAFASLDLPAPHPHAAP